MGGRKKKGREKERERGREGDEQKMDGMENNNSNNGGEWMIYQLVQSEGEAQ